MDMEWFDRVIVARDRKINDLEATLKTERALMERQLAALAAERDAARAAADPDLSDYYEPAIVVTELQNEVAALRAQLAAAQEWRPVGAADPDIVCGPNVRFSVHGPSLAIIGDDWLETDDGIVCSLAELPADYALCRRTRQEPPA